MILTTERTFWGHAEKGRFLYSGIPSPVESFVDTLRACVPVWADSVVPASVTVEDALIEAFCEDPNVLAVCLNRGGGQLHVTTVLEDPAPECRRRVYDKEVSLFEQFPDRPLRFSTVPQGPSQGFHEYGDLLYTRKN